MPLHISVPQVRLPAGIGVTGLKPEPLCAKARLRTSGMACGSKGNACRRAFCGMTESHAPSHFGATGKIAGRDWGDRTNARTPLRSSATEDPGTACGSMEAPVGALFKA